MKKRGLRRLAAAAAGICLAAAVWFGYSFYDTLREYGRGEEDVARVYELMEEIRRTEAAAAEGEGDRAENPEAGAPEASAGNGGRPDGNSAVPTQESLWKLKAENEDLVGWIQIEGTTINYPVMQTPAEPDFYLTHGFDRAPSVYGMIYMDAGCSLDGSCKNYLLYGHHMKNGSMFAPLERYADESFYRENPDIRFDTLEESGTWEIFAVLRVPAASLSGGESAMLSAGTEEHYRALMEYAEANRLYDTGITPEWPEPLLTLATCEYTQKDGRFLVFARRAH